MVEAHSNKMDCMGAIVTGASRGLGRAIAKEFAAEGANVVVSARRNSPTGQPGTAVETAQDIRANGGEAMALTCDVSNEEQVMHMVGQTIDMYGRIDVLVNNAGVSGSDPDQLSSAIWDQQMSINAKGVFLGMPNWERTTSSTSSSSRAPRCRPLAPRLCRLSGGAKPAGSASSSWSARSSSSRARAAGGSSSAASSEAASSGSGFVHAGAGAAAGGIGRMVV